MPSFSFLRPILSVILLVAGLPVLGQDRCVDYSDFPPREAQVAMPGIAQGMAVQGNRLYVAAQLNGLQIVDISDPAAPVKISSLNTPGQATDVDCAGNLVYLADGMEGLQIIDTASPPNTPVLVGSLNTPGYVRSVVVVEGLAYLGADLSSGGLIIVDVSQPESPVQLSISPGGGSIRDLAVRGDFAYLADYDGHIYVYDVSDPAAPILVNAVEAADGVLALDITGDLLVAALNLAGIQVFDLADPGLPEPLGGFQPNTLFSSSVHDVSVEGNRGYCVDNRDEVVVFDLTDPTAPRELAALPQPADIKNVAVAEGLIFAALGDQGVRVIQNVDFELPLAVGTLPAYQNFPQGPLAVNDTHAFVASDQLVTVRINSVTAPLVLATAGAGEDLYDLGLQGDHAYVISDPFNRILVFNVANPWTPQLVNTINTAGNHPDRLVTVGNRMYSGPHSYALGITDITEPGSAFVVDYASLSLPFSSLAVQGDSLFVGGFSEVEILDISDRDAPQLVGSFPVPATVEGMTVQGDRAYLLFHNRGLDIVDLSQPDYPVIGQFAAGELQQITIHRNVAYLSDLRAGLYVLDISDETQPRLLGMKRGGCAGSAVVGEHLVVSGSGYMGGVEILPLQCDGLTPAAEQPAYPQALSLTAYPNPFNPQTRLEFSLNEAAAVEVAIHDLKGRLVRNLVAGQRLGPGTHAITWDGLSDQGRQLSSGKYFCSLKAGARQTTQPLILLK